MAEFEKTDGESEAVAEEDTETAVPPDCQVIFFNDDFTTKDFVVAVLVSVFHKAETEAVNLMETVHRSGSAVVGVYTYDIAATRADITVKRAREEGFPLRVEIRQI